MIDFIEFSLLFVDDFVDKSGKMWYAYFRDLFCEKLVLRSGLVAP